MSALLKLLMAAGDSQQQTQTTCCHSRLDDSGATSFCTKCFCKLESRNSARLAQWQYNLASFSWQKLTGVEVFLRCIIISLQEAETHPCYDRIQGWNVGWACGAWTCHPCGMRSQDWSHDTVEAATDNSILRKETTERLVAVMTVLSVYGVCLPYSYSIDVPCQETNLPNQAHRAWMIRQVIARFFLVPSAWQYLWTDAGHSKGKSEGARFSSKGLTNDKGKPTSESEKGVFTGLLSMSSNSNDIYCRGKRTFSMVAT